MYESFAKDQIPIEVVVIVAVKVEQQNIDLIVMRNIRRTRNSVSS